MMRQANRHSVIRAFVARGREMHRKTDQGETAEMTFRKAIGISVTALTVGLVVACSFFNAAPSECIAAG